MSWFDSSGFASLTKNAFKEVQRKLDNALDIKQESEDVASDKRRKNSADLTASVWGSFTGSFFENAPKGSLATPSNPSTPSLTIVEQQPPRSLTGLTGDDCPKDELRSATPTDSAEESASMKSLDKVHPEMAAWSSWEENTMDPTTTSSPEEKNIEFTDVSLLDEATDGEGFASSRLVVEGEEKSKQTSNLLATQQPEYSPVDPSSVTDGSQSDFSVKSGPLMDLNSPDSSDVLTSASQSPCVIQPTSVRDCLIQAVDFTRVQESPPKCSPINVTVPPKYLSHLSALPKDSKTVLILAEDSTDPNSYIEGAQEAGEVLQSPDESPTGTSSVSVEIMSSESLAKSSSIEVLSSHASSVVTSPDDGQFGEAIRDGAPAITKQPTSCVVDWAKCSEDYFRTGQDIPSVSNFAEDSSACESMYSTSTSSTHTVLDAFPSQVLDMSEGLIDTMESESYDSIEKDDDVNLLAPDCLADEPEEQLNRRKHIEEQETEIENLIDEVLQRTTEANRSESESQQGSSTPERETPSSGGSGVPKTQSDYTSGRSSNGEVEAGTATSSGIEIISSPSLNDSNGSYRVSPMVSPPGVAAKVWLSAQKGLRVFMPGRVGAASAATEETVPSSLTTSFASISESSGDSPQTPGAEGFTLQISKVNQALMDFHTNKKGHKRNISSVSEYSESSSDAPSNETDRFKKKLAQLNEIIDAREAKVLELSQLNSTLAESNYRLKLRLDEVENLKKGTDSNEAIREECTQRLASMERKFQKALREKENLTKVVEQYREEAVEQHDFLDLLNELQEKEKTIKELMSEGEKLSKQQLTYSNLLKKLRVKERESETVTKDQKSKLAKQSAELDRLQKQLGAKEELERKQIEAIRQLTVANQKLEFDLKDAIADREESDGKSKLMKEALDTAYREVGDLQKTIASNDAEAQQESLKSEIDARQTMESALNELKRQTHQEHLAFLAQIHELQDSVRTSEDQANRKERQLKSEISELLERLREAEDRNKEMSDSVAAATRPLLRQLENLHASQKSQQEAWEVIEESLSERLRQTQKSAAMSLEKERAMKEEHSDAISELTNFQTKVTQLEMEKYKLEAEKKLAKEETTDVQEARAREKSHFEDLRGSFNNEIESVRRENDNVRNHLELEKASASTEKRKNTGLQQQLTERDSRIAHLQTVISSRVSADSSPTPSVSRMSASESLHSSNWMDDVFDSTPVARGASLYDSLRGHNAMTVEIMTSTLRQRESELHHLQSEVARSEAQKENLGRELLLQVQKTDELTAEVNENKLLKGRYDDMDKKYNALLQMYGEKIEEVDELRLDLADVKEMYKIQIEQLLQK